MHRAEGMGMGTFIQIIFVGILASLTWAQHDRPPYPVNCTEIFDHSYTLDELLDQFRDDAIRMNMSKAAPAFWSHPDLTIEYVYNALNHEDWQVRQVICHKIWQRHQSRKEYRMIPPKADGQRNGGYYETIPGDPRFTITADLVRVTIEGLRHDTTPYNHPKRRALMYTNAKFGTIALIPVAHLWTVELDEAMESDDGQQRYLAAHILARAGVVQSIERAAEILLPHLRNNNIRSDANFSVYALAGFGDELEPILKKALPAADEQQRDLIMLLLWNIREPAMSEADRIKRSRFNSITKNRYDPSQEPHRDVWSMIEHFE